MGDRQMTSWLAFDRGDLSAPAELLGRIVERTADHWLTVEPVPVPAEGGRLFRHKPKASYSVTIAPYARDESPHFLLYLTFPKGPKLTERGYAVRPPVEIDDEGRDDATIRVPLTTSMESAVSIAVAALEASSEDPLGSDWRAILGDNVHLPYQAR
jgi:hypothetical protein